MTNIFQNPTLRLVIVVIIVTAISIGIVFIVRGLLTNDLDCKDGTILSNDGTKCLPKCDKGYKNDTETGKCILDCGEDGEPMSIYKPSYEGIDRCVQICGDTACDINNPSAPEDPCIIDGREDPVSKICGESNCYTPGDAKPSLCGEDNCVIDKSGKLIGSVPTDTKYNSAGCQTIKGKTCPSGKSTNPFPPPSRDFICCDIGTYPKFTIDYKSGICCTKDTDKAIRNSKGIVVCCPEDSTCKWTPAGSTTQKEVCLGEDETCTSTGPCPTDNVIRNQSGDAIGCCLTKTIDGKCKNVCASPSENMKSSVKCKSSSDCKPAKGEVANCVDGTCRLVCGDIDEDDIVCLNDTVKGVSSCLDLDKSNICEYDFPTYGPGGKSDISGLVYCKDNTKTNRNAWRGDDDRYILGVSSTYSSKNKNCTPLSCLNHFATKGILSSTISSVKNTDGRNYDIRYPEGTQLDTKTSTDPDKNICSATINCKDMILTPNPAAPSLGGLPSAPTWSTQPVDPEYLSLKLTTDKDGVFDGSWSGKGLCDPSMGPDCVALDDDTYARYGTLDGTSGTAFTKITTGIGCRRESTTDNKSTYPSGIKCKVIQKASGPKMNLNPIYFCDDPWNCCDGKGVPDKTWENRGKNCNYFKTAMKDKNNNVVWNSGCGVHSFAGACPSEPLRADYTTQVTDYLSLENTLSDEEKVLTWNSTVPISITGKYSNAIVLMKTNGKYLSFDNKDKKLKATAGTNSKINFYYNYISAGTSVPKMQHGNISGLKGMFRWGRTKDFADSTSTTMHAGRPVKSTKGSYGAILSSTWLTDETWNPYDDENVGNLSICKIDKYYYLCHVRIYRWKVDSGYSGWNMSPRLYLGKTDKKNGIVKFDFEYKGSGQKIDADKIDIIVLADKPGGTGDSLNNGYKISTLIERITKREKGANDPTIQEILDLIPQYH